MIEKNEAIRTIIKMVYPTMHNAALFAQGKEVPGQKEKNYINEAGGISAVNYEGDLGTVRIEFADDVMRVLVSKPDDKEFRTVSTTLFRNEDENFDRKELQSIANEIIDSVSQFYGVAAVYEEKKGGKGKGQSNVPAAQKNNAKQPANQSKKSNATKKKKSKKAGDEYDAIDLAYRLEAIFPEVRGAADENMEKYGRFLPEQYCEDVMTAKVTEAVKEGNRQTMKRLFKAFNLFYDEGEKDTQSIVAVSLLGLPLARANDQELTDYVVDWCDDSLGSAVSHIVKYYSHGKARKLAKYDDPKPYKPTAKERAKKTALQSLNGSK